MARILIAEDDAAVGALVRMNLELAGHAAEHQMDGKAALEAAGRECPDLAIVDLMMPEMDGWELTEHLVKRQIPVIILTARDALSDRVKGLNLGADDYIVKPFEAVELIARASAVLRRARPEDDVFELDGVTVYPTAGYARRGNETIALTNKEFEVLVALIRNRNRTLSREKLLSLVWGYDFLGETRTVDLHVQRVRKKLSWHNRIVVAYKRGYRLECD